MSRTFPLLEVIVIDCDYIRYGSVTPKSSSVAG